ncbi:prephenate dehydrogenase [Uliginosibacterium sp. sgz301328]|uniref:prephenate dehydrogenase n=1 Tax=Uliginosibacterium sp. sgz301328 TaxID=3243764 RepID=UPI00359DEFE0
MVFDRVVVAGVGLIGGSFALALKAAGVARHIVGVGRRKETLDEALALGIIDEASVDWASALRGADFLLLAMPVGQMENVMAAAAPHLEPHTIVTDAGSTKSDVVDAIYRYFGSRLANVVPSHPIAGAEKSGPSAARVDLFRHRKVVVTPLEQNAPHAIEAVRAAWAACGAELHQMTPAEHDGVFAAVSHLPHLLAFGLVDDLARRPNAEQLFDYAASGFRDFTRIAGSHPEMWRDICVANRMALLKELDAYVAELARLRELLDAGDGAGLEKIFACAREARTAWGERRG